MNSSSVEPATHPKAAVRAGGANPFLTGPGHLEPAASSVRPDSISAPVETSPVAAQAPPPAAAAPQPTGRRLGRWRPAQKSAAPAVTTPPAAEQRQASRAAKGTPRQVTRVRASLLVPRPDVFTCPTQLRGVHSNRISSAPSAAGWFLLAAHGGAGAGLLSRLSSATSDLDQVIGQDAGQLWPAPSLEITGAVVVVTRTTVSGLTKARDLAAQYLAGAAPPGTELLGVVLVADQPGKPPAAVATSVKLLDGVFARTWQVPYVPQYRLIGPDQTPPMHPLIGDVLSDICAVANRFPDLPTTEGPSQ